MNYDPQRGACYVLGQNYSDNQWQSLSKFSAGVSFLLAVVGLILPLYDRDLISFVLQTPLRKHVVNGPESCLERLSGVECEKQLRHFAIFARWYCRTPLTGISQLLANFPFLCREIHREHDQLNPVLVIWIPINIPRNVF